VITPDISATAPFDLWASVYDQQQNPLLQIENRFLKTILPPVASLYVLDVGCGTGRWLQSFSAYSPRSLTGVDSSPEMLRHAATKVGDAATLRLGECAALPVSSRSTDLLIASFVLSYVTDLETFAFECSRVCRPGADLFLTDMHPATQRTCNWKRSFQHGSASINIDAQCHPLQDIVSTFRSHGFSVVLLLEPCFGPRERKILRLHGKPETVEYLPPIYLMQFRKDSAPEESPLLPEPSLCLTGAQIAHGAHEHTSVSIEIRGARIRTVYVGSSTSRRGAPPTTAIDLSHHLVLPGLINAHDHLEFGLYPNLGHGPYTNAAQWADEIHHVDSALIERHRAVPRDVRLWWGAIRNLLCGVTTVCHHNPLTPELLDPAFPVRVVSDFGWSHSLALDPNLVDSFHSTSPHHPFILHAAEGTDDRSAGEVFELDRLNALDSRTILVHGLALTPQAVDLLNQRGAAVVLCPSSNRFLFHAIPSCEIVTRLRNVLLGSDSPLTAAGDLLDEIRFAQSCLDLTAEEIYVMVTTRAARILHLQGSEGRLIPGATADLIAIKDKRLDPAASLAQLHFTDVELVVLAGRVQLASLDFLQRLPTHLRHDLHPIEVDGHLRWIRAPLQRLFAEATQVLGPNLRLGGRQVRYAGTR
jgi:cytosine/adenosine deaminase-related metal-dependent hydrolase/SAM-dependent methyltransferase